MNQVTTIGLDTSKQVFHMVGLNQAGKVTLRKQLSRQRLLPFFAQLPPSRVGIETCGASHHWARELQSLGHTVRLIPARDVRALLRGQKNDYNDALAIAEAVGRPQQRFTAIRSIEEQDLQALHRLRRGYLDERTALTNRLRGLLAEYGIVVPKGIGALRGVRETWWGHHRGALYEAGPPHLRHWRERQPVTRANAQTALHWSGCATGLRT